jgi:hypothetical protein
MPSLQHPRSCSPMCVHHRYVAQSEFVVEDVEATVKQVRAKTACCLPFGFRALWGCPALTSSSSRLQAWFFSFSASHSLRCAVTVQALQMTLSENVYNPKKVNDWTNSVIDQCLKGLQALGKPFKYIGTPRRCGHPAHVAALRTPPLFPPCALRSSVIPCIGFICRCLALRAVTCIIMQKNGAGLYTTATTFWDTKKDGE